MTSVSLGLRTSGSYGSLQQQQVGNGGSLANNSSPPLSNRKASKLFKEKESIFHWICKFAGRKKVGMLLLCLVSAAVFVWVLYVGKGEDTEEQEIMINAGLNNSLSFIYTGYSPIREERFGRGGSIITQNSLVVVQPPPVYFTGYTLPPGNPCESFTLPPPPADKKRTGPRPCPVCYLPVEEAIALMPKAPSFSPVVKSLSYIHEENLARSEFGGSQFGGYPSLLQRSDSYDLRESMNVHCGFVRGVQPGRQTGYDISDADLFDMEKCQGVVVASAVFGAFDFIQQPKNMSDTAKKNVCFFMFVDEETEKFIKNFTQLDSNQKIGLWRIVVVHNLPYSDPRRNGKVPKLLLHRLFPNARYSIWVDAKLELVVDPYQILERFLWRKNATLAISRHYRRYDVFVEAEANKAAGKYDNASIDFQVDFYRREGLTPYTRAKLPVSSDVPEGCVVIKEHIPISNLFTCLWFNEVDRFTSRDQISFAIVRDKIRSKSNWTIDMFLDCERRNFVVQGYHRGILERRARRPPEIVAASHPPPPSTDRAFHKTSSSPVVTQAAATTTQVRNPIKRARERRPSTKRRHKGGGTVNRDIT